MSVLTRTWHSVNGRKYGEWIHFDDGRALYLAHRTSRSKSTGPYYAKSAWCIDESTLRRAAAQGISKVGVVWKRGKDRLLYLTLLEDFYGPHSFPHFYETRQRGLPMTRFRIHPGLSAKAIETSMRVR